MNDASRCNAVTLIRWLFALSLVSFHGCLLASHSFILPVKGHAVVSVFFLLSGMLSYESYKRRPGAVAYYKRRVKRIFRPYAIVIVACAVGGAALTSLTMTQYFLSAGLWKYLVSNLAFLNFLAPVLPGVFSGNSIVAVNSSLWTMKVEVAFYICLPLIVWLIRRYKAARVIAVIYIASAIYNIIFVYLFQQTLDGGFDMLRRQFPGQLMYFAAGMAAAELRECILRHKALMFIVGAAVWAVCVEITDLRPLEPAAMAVVITVAGYGCHKLSQLSARVPNFTYEVYLLHFPIIQTFVWAGLYDKAGFAAAFAVSLAVVLLLAYGFHRCLTACYGKARVNS